jgi:hypothetical protein
LEARFGAYKRRVSAGIEGVHQVGFQRKRVEAATNLGEHGFREKFNHEDSTSLILRSSVLST